MMFFNASDESSSLDFTIFKEEYKAYNNLLKGDIIKVLGRVEKRNGVYQIIVKKLEKLN